MSTFDLEMPDGTILEDIPEGTTRAQILERINPSEQAPEGLGRTVLEQGLQGVTFGLADEAMDVIGAGIASAVTDDSFGDIYDEARKASQARMQRQMEQNPATSIAANLGGALLTGGAGATTKAGQAATQALTSGGTAARIGKGIAGGALSGGAYGFGTGAGDVGKRLESAATGAALGGAFGGAIPATGAAARGVGSAVLPKIDDALKPLAVRANEFGIPLSIDQLSPTKFRKTLQKVSQDAPLSGADDFIDAQRGAFNKALAKTLGQEADNLSPTIINKFIKDADDKFNVLAKDKVITVSDDVATRLNQLVDDAYANVGEELGGIVEKQAERLLKELPTGSLAGSRIAAARSNTIKRMPRVAPMAREYVGDMVDVIDDTIEPFLDDAAKQTLGQARKEWRNYKTIEPLLEKATDGSINPTNLMQRVASSKYIRASQLETGQDELVDLARIGKELLPIPGGSDTQSRLLTAGIGGTAVASLIEPVTAAFVASGIGMNRGFQKLYNQNPALVGKMLERGQKTGNFKSLIRAAAKASGKKAANEDKINANIVKRLMSDESGSVGGLPMDQASRMARARAQGFDVDNPVYHGTASIIESFSPSKSGALGRGVYLTANANKASNYADIARDFGRGVEANVIKTFRSSGKLADEDDFINAVSKYSKQGLKGSHAKNAATEDLISRGFIGIQGKRSLRKNDIVIFDPKNIRSVNAQFDPAKSNSADLLAMRAPLAIGGAGVAGAMGMPEQAEANPFNAFELMQQQNQPTNIPETIPDTTPQQPANYFDRLAMAESSNNYNAKAKTSSAFGKYQITKGTAGALLKKYGKEAGIDAKDWKKPENQEKLARLLTRENNAILSAKLKRQPSEGDLYVAHFLGSGNAVKLLKTKNNNLKAANMFPQAAKANKSIFYDNGRARSVYEVRKLLKGKVENI